MTEPLGDSAVRIALCQPPTRALQDALRELEPVRDVVLSETHAGLYFCSEFAARALDHARLHALLARAYGPLEATKQFAFETCYDGEDLAAVARALAMAESALVSAHAEVVYRVCTMGFVPGFAYLGDVPTSLAVPRRKTPRASVPANSVAIAGDRTGIYPFAGPGGWNLIATVKHLTLFHPDTGSLLNLGDRVVFERSPLGRRPAALATPRMPTAVKDSLQPHLLIERASAPCLLQDRGRYGWMHQGVSPGGYLWPQLAEQTLASLDESAGYIVLELYGSVTVRCEGAGQWLSHNGVLRWAQAGESITLPAPDNARVSYLAVASGFALRPQLASVSQLLRASLGGLPSARHRPLRAGDRVPFVPANLQSIPAKRQLLQATALSMAECAAKRIAVMPGPDVARFSPGAFEQLLSTAWTVSAQSDRVGVRLHGPALSRTDGDLGRSAPMVAGAIQVPADGAPIVLGVDHPTVGGYPVLAVVRNRDVGLLCARAVGQTVRFSVVP
jgi:allophanate hydrolase subunit 2/allophanate hydrolase subunit 1